MREQQGGILDISILAKLAYHLIDYRFLFLANKRRWRYCEEEILVMKSNLAHL